MAVARLRRALFQRTDALWGEFSLILGDDKMVGRACGLTAFGSDVLVLPRYWRLSTVLMHPPHVSAEEDQLDDS